MKSYQIVEPDYCIKIKIKDDRVLEVEWIGMPYLKINKRRVVRLLKEAFKHMKGLNKF